MIKIADPFKFSKKVTLTMVCTCVLIYQINVLFSAYMSGKTVVSLYVGRLESVAILAFTLCTPEVLSMEKASKMRAELSLLYSQYEALNKQLKYLPNHNPVITPESIKIIKEMNNLYQKVNNQIDLSKIPVTEIINNWTLIFDKNYIYFDMVFEGVFRNGSKIMTKFTTEEITLTSVVSLKLQWLSWGGLQVYKCFTIFSALRHQWRDFEMNLERITIKELSSMYKWIPPTPSDNFLFSLHSRNTLPNLNEENFVEIRTDHFYTFFYSQINTELLDSRYDTNCYDYDLDYKYANFNMRSDCKTSCYQNSMRETCHLTNFASSDKLLRADYVKQSPLLTIDKERGCTANNHMKIKASCRNECKFDCSFKYYLLEKFEKKFNEQANWFNLTIQRNAIPDVVIQYLPQTTFISFICNFGGLLGMWLGLSVLTIFDDLIECTIAFISRPSYYLTKIKMNKNITLVTQISNHYPKNNRLRINTTTNVTARNQLIDTISPLSVNSVFQYEVHRRH